MIKKIIFSAFILTTLFSCSSDSTAVDNANGSGIPVETTAAMTTRIDGTIYDTPPQIGGNAADATGGSFGNTYFLLKGYYNTGAGKAKTGFKTYDIKIVVPKNDLTLGSHTFTSSIVTGGYYADFDVNGVVPAENTVTKSGSVTITSYNATTKLLKGNFNFTTNDGVNLAVTTHTLIGSFNYVLQ
jgi:hypothetical protein